MDYFKVEQNQANSNFTSKDFKILIKLVSSNFIKKVINIQINYIPFFDFIKSNFDFKQKFNKEYFKEYFTKA